MTSPREVVLKDKADAIRRIADYLERYPNAASQRILELETAVREYKELVYGTEPVQTQSLANVLDEGTIGVTQFDDPVGFDVVGGDLPLNDFEHCEGCHSHVCQAIGTCQHTALAPYKAAWKR